MPCGLFYRFPHLVVAVQIKDIGNEVEGILIVLDLCVESSQVESIRQVVLVDFAEIFVAPR